MRVVDSIYLIVDLAIRSAIVELRQIVSIHSIQIFWQHENFDLKGKRILSSLVRRVFLITENLPTG